MVSTVVILACLLCGLASAVDYELDPHEYQQLRKLQSLSSDFTEHFQNITLLDFDLPIDKLPDKDDLRCLADMGLWIKSIREARLWSLMMIDAWGSIPSGLLMSNLNSFGSFDECLAIKKEVVRGHTIKGKYCFVEFPFLLLLGAQSDVLRSSTIKIATCFPASCSATHMNTFMNTILKKLIGKQLTSVSLMNDNTCFVKDSSQPLDGLAIFTIVLLSIFAGVALLATMYDYFLCADQKKMPPLIKIFSIRATSRALFRLNPLNSNPNVIECLNGMRCMSLFWVIFGHEYIIAGITPNINNIKLFFWLEEAYSLLIQHAYFSVDTFFFLSGLLVVMIALRAIERAKGKMNIPLMYLHRYLRLTPLLAVAILVYMKILPLLVTGPLRVDGFPNTEKCEKTWYLTLLCVQNYATDDICLPHSWYLGVDMQLYLLSPILLFALYKWGKKAAAATVVLIVLLTVWLFTLMMVEGYSMFIRNILKFPKSQKIIYFSTHLHATPWLIGAVFGYFLHVTRGKSYKLNRLVVWAGWICALAIFFASIFALLPYNEWRGPKLSKLSDSLYYSLTRIGWPIGLCWVVFACMQGFGGMANSFLSSPLWQPLARLSYSVYLWHMFVQEVNQRRHRTNTYFSNYEMMLNFWHDLGFTLLMSYVLYVIIEAPLGGLEGLLMRSPRPAIAKSEAQPEPEPEPEPRKKDTEEDVESAPDASPPVASPSAVSA